ncbi:DUF4192 domain-containing protein [Streptomyces sp. NPDC051907]|uniref:DUF4192 domain-containing protein n=1 Tax=Streptomyces sp. NPDC051907 TaxID=3155284 RepID=UPI00342F732A
MNKHYEPTGPAADQQITLRGPAELADALPYMLGFHPDDSIVMVALHGSRGRFGGRLRLGIPGSPREWSPVAEQLADSLIESSERRGARPDGIVVFVCQDPAAGETSRQVMERLRPLAQRLRTACGDRDVPVYEALCVSDGRYWSYCCPDTRCCPPEGSVLALPGTSVMAAAAAYAGIQVRGTLREMEGRLSPWTTPAAVAQEQALDSAGAVLLPRLVDGDGRKQVRAETVDLARALMKCIEETPPAAGWAEADASDDRLITDDEAASLILGLQDRETRDRAAEWMEGPEAEPALRLWRALSRRCVGPYLEHAAAPLALAGWVCWSTGDEPGARVALGLALRSDPDYVFARLLHQACNEDLDPETLRSCLRSERDARVFAETGRPGRPRRARTGRPKPGAGQAKPGAGQGRPRRGRSRPGAGQIRPRSGQQARSSTVSKRDLPVAGAAPDDSASRSGARPGAVADASPTRAAGRRAGQSSPRSGP